MGPKLVAKAEDDLAAPQFKNLNMGGAILFQSYGGVESFEDRSLIHELLRNIRVGHERSRMILDSMSSAVITVDRSGRILSFNRAAEDLTASVATTLGVDLQRSVNLEYRLSDRTSLLGTWESESEGQAGAIGGGVKFRREFRRIPGFSLLGTTGK